MLIQIHIRDLATIEALHLPLQHGCTMITGETGAGKSIFIEAIELCLGARASVNLIRPGKEKADISLGFDITRFPHVLAKLAAQDLADTSHECIIRRVIMQDGRSRCYVNGVPVTVQLVKELGELLFHLHGQHEQQVLIKSDTQREMLDRFADHWSLVHGVKQIAENLRDIDAEMSLLRQAQNNNTSQQDYLQFQLEEITALNMQNGEWETLESEHRRLLHKEELLSHLQNIRQRLAGEEEQTIIHNLNSVYKIIESITAILPRAKEWNNILHPVIIQLIDLASDLENYLEQTEADPNTLQAVEERVSEIFKIARKHKINPNNMDEFTNNLRQKLAHFANINDQLTNLSANRSKLAAQYHELAAELSASRQEAARRLENEITTTIQSLSLPHGEFKIAFEKDEEVGALSPHGKEKIIFLIKTNPDQVLQPLAKVISGGELSRLSLACHLALANKTSIPTLIFDEVDTGLSGATAEKIGKLLRHLGRSYQVFCITHQPQVAAYGLHHLLVEKYFLENNTYTNLRLLSATEKTQEIARMLGGEKLTPKTLAHAQEILDSI